MRPNRPAAGGYPDTTSPGGGALQPVLARFFSRHRTGMCPEACRPGHIDIPGPPSLPCYPGLQVLRHHRPMLRRIPGVPDLVGARAVSSSHRIARSTRTGRPRLVGPLRNGAQ